VRGAVFLQKVISEEQNVGLSFPQAGQIDREYIKPVKKVFAKNTVRNRRL
jgi:hypothetical protein